MNDIVAIVFGVSNNRGREDALVCFLVGFGIIFPIAYAIAVNATLYDGMRHFTFVLPLIAVVAALVANDVLIE